MLLDQRPVVTVCVCTYKRPERLLMLLGSLAVQTFPLSKVEVVVVDNDSLASAREAVERFTRDHPALAIRYAVEPDPGISYARNRTVSMAAGDLLAFVDDDEIAAPDWLQELVSCIERHACDAVVGPVLPEYPPGTPQWVLSSRFFERPRFAQNAKLLGGDGRTGNSMVRRSSALRRSPWTFDPRLAKTGGEDCDFFRWLEASGGAFIWCDTAVVCEEVPVARQSLAFILERSLRSSVTYWRPLYTQNSWLWVAGKSALGLILGFCFALAGLFVFPVSRAYAVRAWARAMKAVGRLAALSSVELTGYGK